MHQSDIQPRASVFYRYRVHDERRPSSRAAPVLIVGAGPVGLLTALDLARFGVPSVVLTEERQVTHGSRAVVLTRRSLEILQQVGVERPFLAKGLPWDHGRSFYRDREVYRMVMPHDPDDRFLPALNLQQQYMEEFLVEACERSPLIELCWGQKLVGIRTTDGGATLRVDCSSGEYELAASWVVAADGGRSTLRRLLDLRMEGRSYAGRFVICDIKAAIDLPTERLCFFDPPWSPGSNVLVHRLPDEMWRIDLKLPDGETPEEALESTRLAGRIRTVLEMIRRPVPWALDWATVYSASALTLPDYQAGRVLFVGDAAHLLPIFGVRGLNTGAQDANNLAWKLAFAVRGWAPAGLLRTYSEERVQAAREICAEAGRSTRFMTPPTAASQLLRDAVLSFSLSEDFPKELMHWRTSRPHDYVGSPLNSCAEADRAFTGGIACGQPVRNVRLGRDDYLLDRLGARPGFHVFVFARDAALSADAQALLAGLTGFAFPIVRVLVASRPEPGDAARADVVVADPEGVVHARYAAGAGSVYLLRPDLHVCARWLRASARDVRGALEHATVDFARRPVAAADERAAAAVAEPAAGSGPMLERRMSVQDLEQVYDLIADALEECGPGRSELFLAKLALALANAIGSREAVAQVVRASLRDLPSQR